MSFTTSAGRMVVTDGSTTVFDTNERLFTVTDGPYTGSFTLPDRTATQRQSPFNQVFVDIDTNHTLSGSPSANASANTIRGAFKVTGSVTDSGVARLAAFGWFNASGSYVHFMRPQPPILNVTSSQNTGLPNFAVYTFVISGGQIKLNEQCRLAPNPTDSSLLTTTMTLPGATLQYYLFAGAWI